MGDCAVPATDLGAGASEDRPSVADVPAEAFGPWRIRTVDVTASTNDDVRLLAKAGAPQGSVVVARRQEAGRGQWRRVWKSPEGGLYFSFLLRPGTSADEWPAMSPAIAADVREALIGHFGIDPAAIRVKLPNDIVCDRGKLCGIVLEAFDGDCVVVGIGVNVLPPAEPIVTDGRNVPAYAVELADAAWVGAAQAGMPEGRTWPKAGTPEACSALDGLLEAILGQLGHLI